jgi:geranylgeranyl pyrophosphate synthase
MYWTGRGDYDLRTLETIHRLKTGALMGAACAMGAIAARAPSDHVKRWREFGVNVGLAFQAIDDAIDGNKSIGKTPNKDKIQKKLTYMTLFAAENVLALARKKTEDAKNLIPGNVSADRLINFVDHLLSRQT